MLSALITSKHSYPALPLAGQLAHQRFVPLGPLVLERTPLKFQRLQQIGDQPVSRRFEPSSRTSLIGEQPNPWELLHPRDEMSRPHMYIFPCTPHITVGADYIFIVSPHDTDVLWRINAIFIPRLRKFSRYGVLKPILYFIESMMYGVIILVSFCVSALLQYIR